MLSRSRKISSKRIRYISVMKTHHIRSMVKVAITFKEKDKERMVNPRTTGLSHKQRRVKRSQRRTLENGVSSTKFLGTTLMNVTPKNHCWLR
jgi:hypothetical protein